MQRTHTNTHTEEQLIFGLCRSLLPAFQRLAATSFSGCGSLSPPVCQATAMVAAEGTEAEMQLSIICAGQ